MPTQPKKTEYSNKKGQRKSWLFLFSNQDKYDGPVTQTSQGMRTLDPDTDDHCSGYCDHYGFP